MENPMKKISIIIPCYNVEKYIDQCVKSLVSQTIGIESLELIFVDDASTDQTLSKLKEWEKQYPDHIMIIPCPENGQQGTARNIGMNYASGEYIGFVDSDDYVSEEMYERLWEPAEKYHCDIVGCLFVREDENGVVQLEQEPASHGGRLFTIQTTEDRKQFLQRGVPGGIWCKIYRRKLLLDNALWFPEQIRYEDNYWGAFVSHAVSSFYIINEAHYHYVIHEHSTIMQQDALHHLDRLVIELMKVEEYKRRGLFDTYHDEIEFSFLKLYFINTIRILFVRFHEIPYDIIYTMQQNVKELFPSYQRNPYLKKLPPLQQELLKIVEAELTTAKIDTLAQAYRKVLAESMTEKETRAYEN